MLLAISAVWCHWCHVMDETTYSSQDVISAINRRFIPVRVDNDQRPDVNARYNQGGWPTTAILTPEGELLKGATYVPPEQMHHLLAQIDAFYAQPDNRREVAERVRAMRERRSSANVAQAGVLKPEIPDRVFSFLDANFDEHFAGFGTDQKFPQTNALHFLLDRWARMRDDRARQMAQTTLRAMAGGGMYDRVHGGFFRYSTTRDFSVPHFEKMLEDLGGLLYACARASAMFDDAELGRVAIEVRAYLDAHLWNAEAGGYGGSQDADEEYYGHDAAGRAALREPYVDPTIYTAWNAEAARALIASGPLLEARGADAGEWTQRGIAVLDTLWSTSLVDGLMCRFNDGTPRIRGLLVDQAWSAWAALTAFEATGDSRWLDRASALVDATDVLFHETGRAYADRPDQDVLPGRLSETSFPLDDNALMSRVLMKLSSFTESAVAADRARLVLETYADAYRGHGMFAAAYGSAVLDWFLPPLAVKIVGPADADQTIELREAARQIAVPLVNVDVIDPTRDAARLTALGHSASEEPTAYVCNDKECFARVRSAEELDASLSQSPAART